MTCFGNSYKEGLALESSGIPVQCNWCPDGKVTCGDMVDAQGANYVMMKTDWSNGAASQGLPEVAWKPQSSEGAGGILSYRFHRERVCSTLISEFWAPEL